MVPYETGLSLSQTSLQIVWPSALEFAQHVSSRRQHCGHNKGIEAAMVNLVKHDLEFILKQIKIAEAHSAAHSSDTGGTPLTQIRIDANGNIVVPGEPGYADATPAIPSQLSPYGLRTVDGSYNNLVVGREEWGAADQPFLRVTDPYIRENYGTGGSVTDADPRTISNLIVDQTLDNPAAIYAALVYAGVPAAELLPKVEAIRGPGQTSSRA